LVYLVGFLRQNNLLLTIEIVVKGGEENVY